MSKHRSFGHARLFFGKGSPENKFAFSRLRFESDLVDLIEQSLSNSELFRILCD